MQKTDISIETQSSNGFATICGSPGARVRFMGFFAIFWPFLIVILIAGWLLHCAFPVSVAPTVASLLLLLLATVAWLAFNSAEKRFGSFLKGARGEEIVARELSLLPAGWDVFHGIARSGFEAFAGGSDFDHIVIGPDTMFVVETKHWDGPVTLERGTLRVRGRIPRRSPVAQVRREAMELAEILKDAMPNGIVVTPVICFAGDGFVPEEGRIDDVSICNARMLQNVILETSGEEIDERHRHLIIECLSRRIHG